MKKFICILPLFLLVISFSKAQPGNDAGKHHTIGELSLLGKIELTNIYIAEVQKLTLLLPYIPFNQRGEATSLSKMGIPNTKDNNESVKRLDTSGGTHNESIAATLPTIIPYADSKDVVRAILFLQDIIERIEAGI